MTDLDRALVGTSPAIESAVTVVSSVPRCLHPRGSRKPVVDQDGKPAMACGRCDVIIDAVRAKRGKSSRRLGSDQERRIEKVYGPRKVGEYGDAIDLIGRDFVWQSKATRDPMPSWASVITAPDPVQPSAMVLRAARAMEPLRGSRQLLVIQTWVGTRWHPTRDLIWVEALAWAGLHGDFGRMSGWVAMSGEHFLLIHGRDE